MSDPNDIIANDPILNGTSPLAKKLPPERYAKIVAARREKLGLPPLDEEAVVAEEPAPAVEAPLAAATTAAPPPPAAAAPPPVPAAELDPIAAADPILNGTSPLAKKLPPERYAKIVAARREKLGLPPLDDGAVVEEPVAVAPTPAPTPVAAKPAAPAPVAAAKPAPAQRPAAAPAAAAPVAAAAATAQPAYAGTLYTARLTPALARVGGATTSVPAQPVVKPEVNAEDALTRRRVVRYIFFGALAGVTGQMVAGFLNFFYPKKVGAFGGQVPAGVVSDFPLWSVTRIREGKYFISHVPDGLIALYWKCAHLGCTVPWSPNEEPPSGPQPGVPTGIFHCPCHGSLYNRWGEVIGGPAPRPLSLMAITLNSGRVVVDTGKITQRTKYEKDQATKV